MLVFAVSDKGGTGRSVTSSNIVYRTALNGRDVCYLDFDFGSPTAGTVFQIEKLVTGLPGTGLHSYLQGRTDNPFSVDVWAESEGDTLRRQPPGSGRLELYPGDRDGGEFSTSDDTVDRCADLFLSLEEQFDVVLVDLSAGRSYAVETVLAATAAQQLQHVTYRWLVFHRWTHQHIRAAHNLVFGDRGILSAGKAQDHDESELRRSIRFIRTAVVQPSSASLSGLRPEQLAWLENCNNSLQTLAGRLGLGRTSLLGSVPLEPLLQFREQLISDYDVRQRRTANQETIDAFKDLAAKLHDDRAWEAL
ncbi:SCO2523 family variant P-loop protein [Dactylosporangium sp. NPDC051541]|uniref:SCO2523 family variant P-loop protein n=1 Tax=Dactylosporangium sp. NPDC051541 TaxID=3363977 RepID=UPI003789585B